MHKLKGKPGDKPSVKVPIFQGQFGSKSGFDLDMNSIFEDWFGIKRMDEAECVRNGCYNVLSTNYCRKLTMFVVLEVYG